MIQLKVFVITYLKYTLQHIDKIDYPIHETVELGWTIAKRIDHRIPICVCIGNIA